MILRRFIKHVADQNWIAVGLDIVVVVLGIFLGMQLSDWNEQQKDFEKGRYHLESLRDYLARDIVRLEEEIATNIKRSEGTFEAWFILLKDKHTEEDFSRFAEAHFSAFYLWGPTVKPAPLRRLIDGDGLDLVQSRELQAEILEFESVYEEAIFQTGRTYALSAEQSTTMMNGIEYNQRGLKSSLSEIAGNKALVAAFRAKGVLQRIQLDEQDDVLEAMKALKASLDRHLGLNSAKEIAAE